MRPRRKRLLGTALVGSLLAAGCVSVVNDPARPAPVGPAASAPATRQAAPMSGTTRARGSYMMSGEFSPSSLRPGGSRVFTISKLSPPPGTIEPFRSALTAVLVFPLVPERAGCVQRVQLRLRVLGGRGPRAELAIYPSALLSLAKGRRPDPIPWETLIDSRPRALGEAPLDAPWAEFDVTQLYRAWVGEADFPSAVRHVPAGTPLVASVRPPGWTEEDDFVRRFAGAAAGDNAPHLAWTATGNCGR